MWKDKANPNLVSNMSNNLYSIRVTIAKLYNVAAVIIAFYVAPTYLLAVGIIAVITFFMVVGYVAKSPKDLPSLRLFFTSYAVIALMAIAIAHFFSITDTPLEQKDWQTITATVPKQPTELVFAQGKSGSSRDEFLVLNGKRFRCLETDGYHSSCPKAYPLAGHTASIHYAEDYPYGFIVYEMRVADQALYSIADYDKGVQAISAARRKGDQWLLILFVLPAVIMYLLNKINRLIKHKSSVG